MKRFFHPSSTAISWSEKVLRVRPSTRLRHPKAGLKVSSLDLKVGWFGTTSGKGFNLVPLRIDFTPVSDVRMSLGGGVAFRSSSLVGFHRFRKFSMELMVFDGVDLLHKYHE